MMPNNPSSSPSPPQRGSGSEEEDRASSSGKRKRRESPSPQAGPSKPRSGHTRKRHSITQSPLGYFSNLAGPSDGNAGSSSRLPASEAQDDSESSWVYRLEILQQPQRARACGFGDKDRRPLSPPPIIQLLISTRRGQPVRPELVNHHFLVLMVDLWSGDHASTRNVVMHPSSSAKEPSPRQAHAPMPDSRPSSSRAIGEYSMRNLHSSGSDSAYKSSPGPSPHTRLGGQSYMPEPLPVPSPYLDLERPSFPRAQSYSNRPTSLQPPSDPQRPLSAPSRPHSPLTRFHAASPLRGNYSLPPLSSITSSLSSYSLPPIQSLEPYAHPQGSSRPWPDPPPQESRPSWSTASRSSHTESFGRGSAASTRLTSISSTSRFKDSPTERGVDRWPDPSRRSSIAGYQPYEHSGSPARPPEPPSNPRIYPTQDSTYSRVLVGSLCTVCQKLQGPDGQTGLFFFAHDLGIRTEGTFSLRFALANLTHLMERSGGGTGVLAEAYSDPFQVYSAKRFPGVVPTTELTRVFAKQNVRLPTRQRRTEVAGPGSGAESGEEG